MRHLMTILSIGLLLVKREVSASTAGKDPDQIFKVCNKDFLDKVIEICGGWVWRSEIPSSQDASQANVKQDNSNTTDLKELEKNGIQQLELYEKKQNEQRSGDIADAGQHDLLRESKYRELMRREVALSDRCCNTGCKYQELALLCEP
ncbi:prorelaxin-like [Narcine bancroftii]|uniref:prorelaxin-like n=1 Tax=Narcine bancroftii TaxID=1343680 RepID=UPI003831AAD3